VSPMQRTPNLAAACLIAWCVMPFWITETAWSADNSVVPNSSWYDGDTGKLRPIPVTSSVDDSVNRSSRWLPTAERPRRSTANPANTNVGSGGTLSKLVGWLLLTLIGIGLLAAIVYAIKNSDASALAPLGRRPDSDRWDESTEERMRELPQELQQHRGDLRQQAETSMRSGDFQKAIIFLYGHQLLLLDRHAWLRLSRGKTNHRYVREVRGKSTSIGKGLRLTVDAFERSYFGRHELSAGEFDLIWKNNLDLESQVESSMEQVA